jgi:hypothetical protein
MSLSTSEVKLQKDINMTKYVCPLKLKSHFDNQDELLILHKRLSISWVNIHLC